MNGNDQEDSQSHQRQTMEPSFRRPVASTSTMPSATVRPNVFPLAMPPPTMRPGVLKRPGQTPSSATTTSSQLVGLPQVESLSQTDDLSGIVEPTKQISTQADIQTFLESIAFGRIMAFIYLLNEAALNKKLSDKVEVSEQVISVLNLLDELDSWIDDIPPEVAPQRFGNKAFRKWVAKLDAEADRLHDSLLGNIKDAKTELVPYFTHSFGNETRIDYGSGHELNFLVWLLGLYQVKFLNNQDNAAIVLRLFDRYLTLVRRLQRTYMLEPAGSHGVWGLDDYQFLPYLFGAAQLRDNKRIKPRSIANRELVDTYANEYMYFGAIRYIHEFKSGPFAEHSPLLNDVAQSVELWQKVNQGMIKMYIAEVLKKVPIVQHLYFGGVVIPWKPAKSIKIDAK